jgi:hypothetical protein
MGVDVDQSGHHKAIGIIENAVGPRPARRTSLGARIFDRAALVEHQHPVVTGLVLAPGEELAAACEGLHCRPLRYRNPRWARSYHSRARWT